MGVPSATAAAESLLTINVDGTRSKEPQAANAKQLTRLVYPADEWHKRTGEVLLHGPSRWSKVQYVLNTFGTYGGLNDDIVWLGANLVTGVKVFSGPLKTLRYCGNRATRLLLLLYAHNAMEEWGGVSPLETVFRNYEETLSEPAGRTNYTVSHWKRKESATWEAVSQTVIKGVPHHPDIAEKIAKQSQQSELIKLKNESYAQKMKAVFWPAFYVLKSCWFIYEMVTVTTAQPNQKNPTANDYPLYEQDYSIAEAARNLGLNANMLGRWKIEAAESEGAFRGNGKLSPEQLELRRLKIENRRLRMEREILKKATAFFARESK